MLLLIVTAVSLALAVAELLRPDHPDGVFFIPLVALDDPAHIPAAIARPLGVAEQGNQSLRNTLLAALRERRVLLLLDNFEHLVPAVALVEEIRTGSIGVAVRTAPLRDVTRVWSEPDEPSAHSPVMLTAANLLSTSCRPENQGEPFHAGRPVGKRDGRQENRWRRYRVRMARARR